MSESDPPQPKNAVAGSPWSFRIATVSGIPVRIHFTFLLLLGYIAYVGNRTGESGWSLWAVFAVLVFFFVVLHEFGHALTARHFGIETRDITLYPVGGVAVFEGRMRPHQEFWIALAGPLVNVALAIVLGVFLWLTKGAIPMMGANMLVGGLLPALFYANVALTVFNLIPAFPMDGGRVLRAFLGMHLTEERATMIAGTIGQGLAIVIGIIGVLVNPIWALIALFVYMGAAQEMAAVTTRSLLHGFKVSHAMQIRFRTIGSGETLQTAATMLLAGSQHDFPVVAGEEVIGILTRTNIAQGLASEGPTGYVAGHMVREFERVSPEVLLEDAIELFRSSDTPPIVVEQDRETVGILTQENVSEFIMLQNALRQRRA
jgi:Zn-dependent protease/CBS domain-containing protein